MESKLSNIEEMIRQGWKSFVLSFIVIFIVQIMISFNYNPASIVMEPVKADIARAIGFLNSLF